LSERSRRFRLGPLAEHHDRDAFSCGEDALDRYFRRQASQDRRRDFAQIWVLDEPATGLVAGFYTLSAAEIELAVIPEEQRKRLPRYPVVPALLLGRLAVDERYAGQGIGKRLMFDAFRRACDIADQAGVYALIVDAKHDSATSFYLRFGFLETNEVNRLMILISRLRELIKPPAPS
jgi:GNAT superfamily N-acetyltransferase